jgi:hypothetical protein
MNLPSRSTDAKARVKNLSFVFCDYFAILTNCFPSAFLIISAGTPLNCRSGVMEPHLRDKKISENGQTNKLNELHSPFDHFTKI